jgi:hypothetical protein
MTLIDSISRSATTNARSPLAATLIDYMIGPYCRLHTRGHVRAPHPDFGSRHFAMNAPMHARHFLPAAL